MVDVTLHALRLALADHLDVPFQEAEEIRLARDSSRRLSAGEPATNAHVHVKVVTSRLSTEEGVLLLQNPDFLGNTSYASELLGMTVLGVESPDDLVNAVSDSIVNPTHPDQFDTYYINLEAPTQKSEGASVAGFEVPAAVIVGIAVTCAVLIAAILLYPFYCKGRCTRTSMDQKTVKGNVVTEEGKLPQEKNDMEKVQIQI